MGTLRITIEGDSVERPLAAASIVGRAPWCTWTLAVAAIPASWLEFRWDGRGWQMCVLRDLERTELRGVRGESAAWVSVRRGSEARGPGVVVSLVDDARPEPFAVELATTEVVCGEALEKLVWWEGDQARALDPQAARAIVFDNEIFSAFGREYRLHAGAGLPRTSRSPVDLQHPAVQVSFATRDGKYTLVLTQGQAVETLRDRAVLAAIAYALARADREVAGGFITAEDAAARMVLYEGAEEGAYGPRYLRELRSRLSRGLAELGVANPASLFEIDPAGGRMWRLRARDVVFEG